MSEPSAKSIAATRRRALLKTESKRYLKVLAKQYQPQKSPICATFFHPPRFPRPFRTTPAIPYHRCPSENCGQREPVALDDASKEFSVLSF